ncbi:hypothetical protein OG767_00055 [Micromonospora sp. NBC_01392]|uniref:hypothetical protein n=1 Tax=Micromonospora sp. NBC_01392 TaxID=2903588 RepID=UPI0032468127
MKIGYKLASEGFGPKELIRQAVRAEEVGFDFVAAVQKYVDAGFDHLVLQNAGPDPDGFLDFYRDTLADRLRALG